MDGSAEGNGECSSGPAFEALGEGAFHGRVTTASGVVAVLFSAPQCSACRAWKTLLPQALSDVAQAFFEVDVSAATGVARYYDIFHLPTIYLFRDGVFHAELQCPPRREAIRETALALLAAEAQDEP